MTTIIIVGSNHANTAKYHNTLGLPASVLVTEIDHGQLIGHTCIQDVPDFGVLETILKNANKVYWAESSEDEFYDADSYYDFLYWLQLYNLKYKNVKNFQTIVLVIPHLPASCLFCLCLLSLLFLFLLSLLSLFFILVIQTSNDND